MTPSMTLSRPDSFTNSDERSAISRPSLTYGVSISGGARSRRALIMSAYRQLRALAARQGATSEAPYARVLRLVGALLGDGSPTPQIGSNGEGGVLVEWLVDGRSLTIDFEDETEILISASTPNGLVFAESVTAWWELNDRVLADARRFLKEMSVGLAHPIPLV